MNDQVLTVEKKNNVAVVTLNRPEKANALNEKLKLALINEFARLADDAEVGAILLRGAGDHFCAGQDFNDVILGTTHKDLEVCRKAFSRLVTTIFEEIINMGTPVIAAVRGMVTGEGLPLAASCDLVIASENTVFQFPGTNLAGASIGPAVVAARYMGIKKTLEYLFTGEPLPAADAMRFGMVNRVVPDNELDDTAIKLAEKIAGKVMANPVSVKDLGKRVFYMAMDMERSKAFRFAHSELAQCFITQPAIDGAKLFLEGKLTKEDLQLDGYFED